MYYGFPWLRWDGRQAVLFDLPARKFHVFSLTFWPQDFLFLALLLIIAALSLFFFTALAGRLWCGYACPQTVWTEAFLMMERWTEGRRAERIKLDAAPWTFEKVRRKVSKHLLWGTVRALDRLHVRRLLHADRAAGAERRELHARRLGTVLDPVLLVRDLGQCRLPARAGLQVHVPYARFQSAMFDRNSLIISYDPMRGEPRGGRKRGLASVLERARGLLDKVTAYDYVFRVAQHPTAADAHAQARGTITFDKTQAEPLPAFQPEQLGDCVDCTICVQVCPTGIDIRNGLQYECIACGACIDGCNEVMDKLGYPKGLIRYSTQNAIDGKPTHVLRPRIIVYGLLLLAIIGAWLWGVTHRSTFIVEALRDRNALYRIDTGGTIENAYTLKIVTRPMSRQPTK